MFQRFSTLPLHIISGGGGKSLLVAFFVLMTQQLIFKWSICSQAIRIN
jgi:hypothetical protein